MRLGELVRENGVQAGGAQVVGRVGGREDVTPTRAALDVEDAMVAVGMNGEPLPFEHGFPVRMVVPGLYGYVSACKWLTRIEATTFDAFDAYWIERDWAAKGPIKVASRIDTPAPLREFPAGRRAIAGVAWAQTRGIARVEVRVDDEDWVEAELSPEVNADVWRQWVLPYDFAAGRHTITVRATGADGEVQPEARASPFPDGATGWHSSRWSPPDHPRRPPGRPTTRPGTRRGRDSGPPRGRRTTPPATMRSHGQDKEHHPVKNNLLTRGVLITAVSTLAITLSACGSDDTAESSASAEDQQQRHGDQRAQCRGDVGRAVRRRLLGRARRGRGQLHRDDRRPGRHRREQQPGAVHAGRRRDRRQPGRHAEHHRRHHRAGPGQPGVRGGPGRRAQRAAGRHRALTTVLTHHVIPGRLTPEELAGTHTTLNNDEVTIEGEGETFTIAMDGTVPGMEASVICGNVQTANATVYIIDQVLKPAAM